MKFSDDEFLQEVDIDLGDFSEALRKQPQLYFKYGRLHAEATQVLDHEKVKLAQQSADLDRLKSKTEIEIRKRNVMAGEKVTESAIASAVLQDELYTLAQNDLFRAKQELVETQYTVNIVELAEKIFSKRTELLTALAYLLISENKADVQITKGQAESRINDLRENARQIVKSNRERTA